MESGPSGIEMLNEGIVSEEDTSLRPPLGSSADSNGIIWFFYPEKYIGGGIILVWMSAEGELLGSRLIERDFHAIVAYDMNNSLFTEYKGFEETESIECKVYTPNSDEPLRLINLKDIPPYDYGAIAGNYLYIIGEDNTFTAVYLGEPVINSEE